MLANITCWAIAIALIVSKTNPAFDLSTKLLFAMGFIFLGILSKAVDVYNVAHNAKIVETKNKENT